MKRENVALIAILTLLLFGILSCRMQLEDLSEERAEIQQVIHDSMGWAKNKDKDLLYSCFPQDSNFLILNPMSRTIASLDELKKVTDEVWMDPRFKATGLEVRDLKINFSKSGDVAWFSAFVDDHGEWDGQKMAWINARWTGVLEKRNGKWVIMQEHFSFAIDEVEEGKSGFKRKS
jgi:ketosteroid isomerase-like protein